MNVQYLEFSKTTQTEIIIGRDMQKEFVTKLNRLTPSKNTVIITNETVAKWHLDPLVEELQGRGFKVATHLVPDGEKHKNIETLLGIISFLAKNDIHRNSAIIGLGGGVICDLTGFAASVFKRGLKLALVPTTMLAMVDASYGGKNGININEGKNLMGTFYQPALTCVDINTLLTLPLSQLSYGLVESIKHGLIADAAYYTYLCRNITAIRARQLDITQRSVRRSIGIKKNFIQEDELDQGIRAHLNFGHTFGHALEAAGDYIRLNHCEAVGIGMLMALKGSAYLGILKEDYSNQLKQILQELELCVTIPDEIGVAQLLTFIAKDKKRNEEGFNFVLPVSVGKTIIHTIKQEELEAFIAQSMQI